METTFYYLSPVQVVKVTSQNMKDVAEWCGGEVQETESRRVSGRMDPYVWVPTPKGNDISWAFTGMFVTKRLVITAKGELKTTWAVFRRDYFDKNYFKTTEAAHKATWKREEEVKNDMPTAVQMAMKDALDTAEAKVKELEDRLDRFEVTEGTKHVLINGRVHKVEDVPSPTIFSSKTKMAQVGDETIPITSEE